MVITSLLVVTYILCAFGIGMGPWRFWQINARFFSAEQGIYSKLSIDNLIPEKWRLSQSVDSEALVPSRFPVFLKPEWGQNSRGIFRADNEAQQQKLRSKLSNSTQRYLLQESATGTREFELFSIIADREDLTQNVFTVTEVTNSSDLYPINSKFNKNTRYREITSSFSEEQRQILAAYITQIGDFGISRTCVRCDNIESLLDGNFQVVEINLFVPLPINLADPDISWANKLKFIGSSMLKLAKATRAVPPVEHEQPIFTRMMTYGKRKQNGSRLRAPSGKLGQQQHPLP